jgi:hypothetical protein
MNTRMGSHRSLHFTFFHSHIMSKTPFQFIIYTDHNTQWQIPPSRKIAVWC